MVLGVICFEIWLSFFLWCLMRRSLSTYASILTRILKLKIFNCWVPPSVLHLNVFISPACILDSFYSKEKGITLTALNTSIYVWKGVLSPDSSVCGFQTPTSNSQKPSGCPRIQLNSGSLTRDRITSTSGGLSHKTALYFRCQSQAQVVIWISDWLGI